MSGGDCEAAASRSFTGSVVFFIMPDGLAAVWRRFQSQVYHGVRGAGVSVYAAAAAAAAAEK